MTDQAALEEMARKTFSGPIDFLKSAPSLEFLPDADIPEVAFAGRSNVGKSTLLNALAGREAAITSEYAGTTRDIIEVRMDLKGVPVTLLDTAGLRETDDIVESIGVELARKRAQAADVRVFLIDPGELPDLAPASPAVGSVPLGRSAPALRDYDRTSDRSGGGHRSRGGRR